MNKKRFINRNIYKRKKISLCLLLFILFLGIGYANIETLLNINGSVNISEYSSYTYSINYDLNSGQGISTNPTSSSANGILEIRKPVKSVTLSFDPNSQGASIKDENQEDVSSTSSDLVFTGWTATGIDTTIAKYGSSRNNVTTLWSDSTTKVGGENDITYFKSLTSSESNVTLEANWEEEVITLPTLEKVGYTCTFNTASDGTGTTYLSEGEYTITNESSNNTLYVRCVDDIKPVITSAVASTTLDYSNYIDFTATDEGSGITGYNISNSSTTEPTTWIPVVDVVESNTETKTELNASWARVFHHNNHQGSVFFENDAKAQSSSEIDRYSVLENIANYKSDKFEFLLQYPDVSTTLYNRWTQTDNPLTTTIANGDGSEYAGGYVGSHIDWNGNYWGGLSKSTSTATLINGSVGHGNWFYAIGANTSWSGSMPGPNSTPAGMVNLWARIDTLSNGTSSNLTRRVGDIRSDGTYYLWVKDSEGNTEKVQVTINQTDTTVPTASITSTNNVATSQTVTLTIGDNKNLDKYYFGTSNPATTAVTYTTTSGTSKTITNTVSDGGVYYLAVVDKAGNRTIVNKTFYKTTLTPNRGSVTPASVITLAGNSFTIPTPGSVTGYTFGGWYKESALTNSAGTNYKPTATGTLYGKWTANKYTVSFNANGGGGSGYQTANVTATYAANMPAISTTKPTRTGYTFGGWYDTSAATGGTQYYTAAGASARTWNKTATTTLYARWSANKYTVSFNVNGGGGSGYQTANVTATYAANMPAISKTKPTKAGYTFGGWYDTSAATGGTQYYTAAGASARTWNKTATTTLYARWTPTTPVSFSNDSWETIIANVKAGNTSKYTVGSTKSVSLGNSLGTHTLRVANNSTPSACSGSSYSQTACGFVLEFADIVVLPYNMHTSNDSTVWSQTNMRTYINSTIYNALPTALKNAVINTKVAFGHRNTSGTSNGTSTDKLYLLSVFEIYGSQWSGGNWDTLKTSQTRQLDYYKNKGVSTSSYSAVIKKYNDTESKWWLRTARYDTGYGSDWDYIAITAKGTAYVYAPLSGSYNSIGVSPAFRIG